MTNATWLEQAVHTVRLGIARDDMDIVCNMAVLRWCYGSIWWLLLDGWSPRILCAGTRSTANPLSVNHWEGVNIPQLSWLSFRRPIWDCLRYHDIMEIITLWQVIYHIQQLPVYRCPDTAYRYRYLSCSGVQASNVLTLDTTRTAPYSLQVSTGIHPASFIQYLTVSWCGLGPTILTAWFSSLLFSLRSAAVMPTPSSTACSSLAYGRREIRGGEAWRSGGVHCRGYRGSRGLRGETVRLHLHLDDPYPSNAV